MDELRTFNDVRSARKALSMISATQDDKFEDMKEHVLLYECAEDLRAAVVAEFVDREKRAPCCTGCSVEARAALYLHSAFGRRHLSTQSGAQLAPAEVEQCAEHHSRTTSSN